MKFFSVYANTILRSAPYLIGIIIGFFIDQIESSKTGKIYLSKKVQVIMWIFVSQWIFIALILDGPCNQNGCTNYTKYVIHFIAESAHKIFWSLSIGWIILACHFGFGGIVNKILSNKFWNPITKISFSLYLIHPIVMTNFVAIHPKETNFAMINVVRISVLCLIFFFRIFVSIDFCFVSSSTSSVMR